MERVSKEKSIIGRINDMSHRLVLMLVTPILISLLLMLFYAGQYSRAISRMETIASLKGIVADEIPDTMWNIVSGRDTIGASKIYATIHSVDETLRDVTERKTVFR